MQYLVLVSVLSYVHAFSVSFHVKLILSPPLLLLLLFRCFDTCAYKVASMIRSLDLLVFVA